MKNDHIPTVITDKNGRITTVYKKQLTASATSTKMPAPSAPIKSLTEAQRSELIHQAHHQLWIIREGKNLNTGKNHNDAIRDLMLTYSDNTVTAMHEYIMADLTVDEYMARNQFLTTLTGPKHNETSSTIHEYLTFQAALPFTANAPDEGMVIVRSLHGYQQLPIMDDYADADEKTKEQITALLTVTNSLYAKYKKHEYETLSTSMSAGGGLWNSPPPVFPAPMEFGLPLDVEPEIRLIGDGLINLIVEQPENADEISRYIIKGGITDGTLLREIFTSDTPSLRDGLI